MNHAIMEKIGTETMPVFKMPLKYKKNEASTKSIAPVGAIQDISTPTTYIKIRYEKPEVDVGNRLWNSHLSSLREDSYITAKIYLYLLKCLYRDRGVGTACILDPTIIRDALASRQAVEIYFDGLVTQGLVTSEIQKIAYRLWERLLTRYPNLPEPDVAPSVDNSLVFAFDDGINHLEFEIFERKPTEVYYLKRSTNEMWEDDLNNFDSLPEQLLNIIGLFVK